MQNNWYMITPSLALSLILWALLAILVLYGARKPFHQAIQALAHAVRHGLRVAAHSLQQAEQRLSLRNREVLLAAGREASERIVEREFDRVDSAVQHELAEYHSLKRKLSEAITTIEEDYVKSAEVPPSPPGWGKAVEAVANIPARSEPMVGETLENIHASLVKAESRALAAYRDSSRERHKLLKRALPYWRQATAMLNQMDKNVSGLLDRTKTIDRHMDNYEQTVRGTDQAVRTLSASSLTQFFISGFVLLIAVGGSFINFNLIARPMAEMVGGTNTIGGWRIADIAALVIILVEISMGLFLMESLRITRLFPVIGALNDRIRTRMLWVVFSILLCLACVEAGLAFMREVLMQNSLATSAFLRGSEGTFIAPEQSWITTAAQMGMSFILPFALTFVAIPLETFIHSVRSVLGIAAAAVLRFLSVTLRVTGNVLHGTANLLINVYDLVIFLPLWIEDLVIRNFGRKPAAQEL
ncbi:MAG TPA: hypothetical protein VFL45_03590 [Gammaproteobacteria bacterium]|nr:hypothetical protein [Gammaproteobacteria bacterium]